MIKLEALRVFVAVAETGNIRDAADRIGRTASAVSMTLKQLEEEIDAPLFAGDRKSALTALGAFMLETARAQVQGYDRAMAAVRAFAQNRIGKLTIACVPSVAAQLVPPLLSGFLAQRPAVELELFDVDSRAVAGLVESGQVEIGIAGAPRTAGALGFTPLFRDPFRVVCRAGGALAALGRPVGWDDLAGETLIRNGASEMIAAPEYRALAGAATLMVRNVTSLVAFARSGLGVTLLPALSTIGMPEGVAACPLAEESIEREVGVIGRRDAPPSPVAAAFLEQLESQGPALIEELGLRPAQPADCT